jgi:hypothetical protein
VSFVAKHVGTPSQCPACVLPEDQFARREAIWLHAVARFADQSGVDVSPLTRSDLAPMIRVWVRADAVARMNRALLAAAPPPRPAADHFEPWSARLALFLMLAVLACLGIICSGVWRFLS